MSHLHHLSACDQPEDATKVHSDSQLFKLHYVYTKAIHVEAFMFASNDSLGNWKLCVCVC